MPTLESACFLIMRMSPRAKPLCSRFVVEIMSKAPASIPKYLFLELLEPHEELQNSDTASWPQCLPYSPDDTDDDGV